MKVVSIEDIRRILTTVGGVSVNPDHLDVIMQKMDSASFETCSPEIVKGFCEFIENSSATLQQLKRDVQSMKIIK